MRPLYRDRCRQIQTGNVETGNAVSSRRDSLNWDQLRQPKKTAEENRVCGNQMQLAMSKALGGLKQMTPGEMQRTPGAFERPGGGRATWI